MSFFDLKIVVFLIGGQTIGVAIQSLDGSDVALPGGAEDISFAGAPSTEVEDICSFSLSERSTGRDVAALIAVLSDSHRFAIMLEDEINRLVAATKGTRSKVMWEIADESWKGSDEVDRAMFRLCNMIGFRGSINFILGNVWRALNERGFFRAAAA